MAKKTVLNAVYNWRGCNIYTVDMRAIFYSTCSRTTGVNWKLTLILGTIDKHGKDIKPLHLYYTYTPYHWYKKSS